MLMTHCAKFKQTFSAVSRSTHETPEEWTLDKLHLRRNESRPAVITREPRDRKTGIYSKQCNSANDKQG